MAFAATCVIQMAVDGGGVGSAALFTAPPLRLAAYQRDSCDALAEGPDNSIGESAYCSLLSRIGFGPLAGARSSKWVL